MKGSKTLLGPILIISLVSIIIGAGAYTGAFFTDVETSKDNTFSAGFLDMKIRDQDEDYRDGVTATWTATDMKPGDENQFNVEFVKLKNSGTIEGDHVEITCDYSVDDNGCTDAEAEANGCNTSQTPDEMAKKMIITRCIYTNDGYWTIDCLHGNYTGNPPKPEGYVPNDWKIEDKDGDGKISFYDLKNDTLDNLPPATISAGWPEFEMSVKFDEDAGNEFQTDIFNLTMIFTLNQDTSQ